ncbi:hypothetical protein ACWDBF_15790 [Streptomyces angustmyceticus]
MWRPELYVAAADVTALLRALAVEWVVEAEAERGAIWRRGDGELITLDAATLRAMAARMTAQADDMDLELILMSERTRCTVRSASTG